ncbi:hypothetical protein FA09DRAFT_335970 [Tilletiopsis washingtonensis]|uniref:Uncharacterized protein n=1 Tax=Tilletiopsis washingtonensis TaxID=58919 RepID=A0A316ZKL9_9BASI|nr:hypothetical protein FA09DRAFT_335970 [Tilletiopsis washingtonensis]PWO01357.1 hypothetical protein FA09DRAFT_335970 [Tilletiopsis washingtonensis]
MRISKAPKGSIGDVRGVLDPSTWGKPHAAFPKTAACSIKKRFAAHQIVMNVDVCGPFVEGFWQTDGCGAPQTCPQWSMDNPGAFNEAYFDLNQAGFWKLI